MLVLHVTCTVVAFIVQVDFICGRYLVVPLEEQVNATGVLKQDWCTDYSSFRTIVGITMYKCGEECMRRARCESVLYHTGLKLCRLRSEAEVSLSSTEGLRKLCLSSIIASWDISVLGRCATKPCDIKSRCYLNRYLIDRCEITECVQPPIIPNSHVSSMTSAVGSSNIYFCDKPYIKSGNSSVICEENGEWSNPDFACYPSCEFSPSFENAVLKPTSPHVYVKDETAYYECKNGYHREDGASHELTCNESGDWSEPRCLENTA